MPTTADQRVAVVGAAGFLGRAAVSALQRSGLTAIRYTRSAPFLRPDGTLDDYIARCESVLWLATSINPQRAMDSALVAQDRQVFQLLLEKVALLPAPPRVVLLSSGGTVYDPTAPPPYREDSPTRPPTAYGRAKLELERLLLDSSLDGVVLRVSNAYGPGQPARSGQGVIAHWFQEALHRRPPRLLGDPGTVRDYVFVADVAEALVAVCTASGALPGILNIGSGKPTTLKELLELVIATIGDNTLTPQYEPARQFDAPSTWLDVRAAREALGWEGKTSLSRGLELTWEHARRMHERKSSRDGKRTRFD